MPSSLPYELTWPGKRPPAEPQPVSLRQADSFGPASEHRNRLLWGDNLGIMAALLPELRGRVDLIYLDPPFLAGQDFPMHTPLGQDTGIGGTAGGGWKSTAYVDRWPDEAAYLQMLYDRLPLLRELLSERGSLIVHVNWRVGHLVQALLDEVFGPGERRSPGSPGFRNEIIWGYGGGGAERRAYRRKHDNLFWYTRSDRWTFNPQFRDYTGKTRQRGLTAVKGPEYELRPEGATLETWWTGPEVQKILSPTARENLKFPTQKPEALLERIVLGHSNAGDLVADFFCGSGTTGAVAQRLGRRWVMSDRSRHAILLTRKRMAELQSDSMCEEGFDTYVAPDAEMWPGGGVQAESVRGPGNTITVRIWDLKPTCPDDLSPALKHRPGTDFIDYWAVDLTGTGVPFHHDWRAYRWPGRRRIPLESVPLPTPGSGMLRIKVVDVFGGETVAKADIRSQSAKADFV